LRHKQTEPSSFPAPLFAQGAIVANASRRRIVIFGLTVSSSWGNGHATVWRGLLRSLAAMGHEVVFFERDVPWYAGARDLNRGDGYDLVLYGDWNEIAPRAEAELARADAGIVTSYCPDAIAAADLILATPELLRVFYDLDTPVTLERLRRGEVVEYLPADGLGRFDLVLSFTGGKALDELRARLGARTALPLYGSVDTNAHQPVPPVPHYACDLSYLGTYAADRQDGVQRLFLRPAQTLRDKRFVIGGSLYPGDFPRTENLRFIDHVPPGEHPAFYCSSRLTLNVTRGAMANFGYCPSGRLFEAAACGTPILSDTWEGLDEFFEPGREILLAQSTEAAVEAMNRPDGELAAIAANARRRVLAHHTADRRAEQLLSMLGGS
jgi:spore maturation protein CgeB